MLRVLDRADQVAISSSSSRLAAFAGARQMGIGDGGRGLVLGLRPDFIGGWHGGCDGNAGLSALR